jgi:hypothetical protein
MNRSRLFVTVLLLLLIPALALASPFVISKPDTAAQKYRLRLSLDNGATWGAWAEGQPFENHLYFDLSTIPGDSYLGQAQSFGRFTLFDPVSGQTTYVDHWTTSAPFQLTVPKTITGIEIIE